MHRFLNSLLIAWTFGLSVLPARAEPIDDHEARRAAFRQGIAALRAEQWQRAFDIYQRLWSESQTYDVALSLGQVELNLGRYRDAAEHLEFGVRNIAPREKPDFAERARGMLSLAKEHVATLDVRVNRDGAEISIDGAAIGVSPLDSPVFVDPGSHVIDARLSGYGPVEQTIDGPAGEARTVMLEFVGSGSGLEGAGAVTDPARSDRGPSPAPGHDSAPRSKKMRALVLVGGATLTGIGVALTVIFAVQGSNAASDADRLRDIATQQFGESPCSSPAGSASAACRDLAKALDRRESRHLAANISLFSAGTAAVATAVTYLLWPADHKRAARAIHVSPSVSDRSSALVLTGSF